MATTSNLNNEPALSATNYNRYLRDIARYPVLPNDQIIDLVRQSRDWKKGTRESRNEARNKILMANQRLVLSIAIPFARKGLGNVSDLTQDGTIGMMRAVRKFRLRSGNKFSTYATWWIRQTIMRSISQKYRTIYLPVNRTDLIARFRRMEEIWLAKHGRFPEEEEVAQYFGFSVKRAASLIHDSKHAVVYLEEQVVSDNCYSWEDSIADADDHAIESKAEAGLLSEKISAIVSRLNPKEAFVVENYFGLNGKKALTFEQIAKKLKCSRQWVQMRHKRIMENLKKWHPELRQFFDHL